MSNGTDEPSKPTPPRRPWPLPRSTRLPGTTRDPVVCPDQNRDTPSAAIVRRAAARRCPPAIRTAACGQRSRFRRRETQLKQLQDELAMLRDAIDRRSRAWMC